MLDFMDRGAPRGPIALPGNATICFTVDIAFEGFTTACQYRGRPTPPGKPDLYSLSFAEYGLRVGIWRLLDLLGRHKLRAGVLANGYAAQRYPRTLKVASDAGHEIVAHGWTNDPGIASNDEETERAEVGRTLEAIRAAVGVSPVGWVSPGYAGSDARRKALVEAGIRYSCDDASDDLPYVVQVDGTSHAVLPRTGFGSNDFDNWFGPRHSPANWLSTMKSLFDTTYKEGLNGHPGWMELVLHAHFAGRRQPQPAINEILAYILGHEGVWACTRREFAQWILDNPQYHG